MPRTRPRFRPPGLKPWTKVGPFGPFRGRLGLHWVIAPIVVGAILLVVGWLAFVRPHGPGSPYVRAVSLSDLREGEAFDLSAQGRFADQTFLVEDAGAVVGVYTSGRCSIRIEGDQWVDCLGNLYRLDGTGVCGGSLGRLRVIVSDGAVYVDPVHVLNVWTPAPSPSPAAPGFQHNPCPTPSP